MYKRVLSLRILAISVTRHIYSVRRIKALNMAVVLRWRERGLVDSRMNIQCMSYRKHPMSVHVYVEPM